VDDAIPQGIPGPGMQTGHEDTTIGVRGLFIAAGVLVGVVVVCQFVLWWWMRDFEHKEERLDALHPGRLAIDVDQFPSPRLQESPPVDLVQMNREERARIASYSWVDKKAGIARIPVDRAMDILAQKGLPKVPAPPPTEGAPPNTSIPPAGKREEAGTQENHPAPEKKADQPRPESKRGGKP
jgi:hypothetical protein